MSDDYVYQVILSNDSDDDGNYRAEILVNAVPSRIFLRSTRDEAFDRAREWVAWHRSHDESVEMIDL